MRSSDDLIMAIREQRYIDTTVPRTGPMPNARRLAAQQRDAALARIGSARRLVIMAAAGLSAAFAALVYSLAPGHHLTSARAATTPSGSTSPSTAQSNQPAFPAAASATALGVGQAVGSTPPVSSGSGSSSGAGAGAAAPQSAPAPVQSSPPVVSGGS